MSQTLKEFKQSQHLKSHNRSSTNLNDRLRNFFDITSTSILIDNAKALDFLFVNDGGGIVDGALICAIYQNNGQAHSVAISGVAQIDRTAAVISGLEQLLNHVIAPNDFAQPCQLILQDYADIIDELKEIKFNHVLWQPGKIQVENAPLGLLFVSLDPFSNVNREFAKRLTDLYVYTHRNLNSQKDASHFKHSQRSWTRYLKYASIACMLFLPLAIPVPLSVSAPVEIIPKNPIIITASQAGIIKNIPIDQNRSIKKGQILVEFDSTELEYELNAAQSAIKLADEKIRQIQQKSFINSEEAQNIDLFKIEREQKLIEVSFAQNLIDRSVIVAPIDGQAIMKRKEDMLGHPVKMGEKILTLADIENIEAEISLDAKDLLAFKPGDKVELYLDSDPTKIFNATIEYISYKAEPQDDLSFAHQVIANLDSDSYPRIGARGTAKIKGETVTLGFQLLRRPLSVARQWLGI